MRSQNKLDLLPLRQCLRPATAAGLAFASHGLLESLSRPDKFQIVGLGEGGQIMAANELALAEARLILEQVYGDLLVFENATVHTYMDAARKTSMVPVMFLRIDAPKAHADALIQRLRDRGAAPQETDIERKRVVLRAEVPLADLLGFGKEVLECTDGSAQVLTWLLRYQANPVRAERDRSPPEGDAGPQLGGEMSAFGLLHAADGIPSQS
jgi:hypothetical protein